MPENRNIRIREVTSSPDEIIVNNPVSDQFSRIYEETVRNASNNNTWRISPEGLSPVYDGTPPSRDRQRERSDAHDEETRYRLHVLRNMKSSVPPRNNRVNPGDDSQCYHCDSYFNMKKEKGFEEVVGGERARVCGSCKSLLYFDCSDCHKLRMKETRFEVQGEMKCHQCYTIGYFECRNCYRNFPNRNAHTEHQWQLYCPNCIPMILQREQESEQRTLQVTRPYSKKKHEKFISSNTGEIVHSSRVFSCEIECQYPNATALQIVSLEKLPKEFGLTGDGSIRGNGIEIQTPQLGGASGEKTIETACVVLNYANFTVDSSCGLHIHLDSQGIEENTGALKSLWMLYMAFEPVFLSFLPKSRQKNQYCRRMQRDYHFSEIRHCDNLEQLESVWYRSNNRAHIAGVKRTKGHDSRYAGFNFHSLIAQGHLEIRYHSGTLSSRKILEWVNIHTAMMDLAQNDIPEEDIMEYDSIFELSEKTEALFNILELSEKSREYFLKRQKKFLVREELSEEALTV